MTKIIVSFEVEIPDDISQKQVEQAVRTNLERPLDLGKDGMVYNWLTALDIKARP